MPLTKKPVTGMKDILPQEMEIRQYVLERIRKTYGSFGFTEIETPQVEHIENLQSKQGGDNEKLIFKIMKRGEKLNVEQAAQENNPDLLSDSGLRYDLTLPLSRYYSNNKDKLPVPFKALQIGNVFRADRPQKGRFRQFCQCDIDILGDASNLAEKELILATSTLLNQVGFENYHYYIVINDRNILRGMQKYAGFSEEDFEKVCIILDKADKIGNDGVKKELLAEGYAEEMIDRYQSLLSSVSEDAAGCRKMGDALKEVLDENVCRNLADIMESVSEIQNAKVDVRFDPTLVRGMGYYTGPVFEIKVDGFSGSVGGGGRYDKMIGRFTGQDTPAVGFSIGFERIITILMDNQYQIQREGRKVAFLLEKKLDAKRTGEVLNQAMELRLGGDSVLVAQMNKNKKFQKEQLQAQGYTEIMEFYQNPIG